MSVTRILQFEQIKELPADFKNYMLTSFANPEKKDVQVNVEFNEKMKMGNVPAGNLELEYDDNGKMVITAKVHIHNLQNLLDLFAKGICYVSFAFDVLTTKNNGYVCEGMSDIALTGKPDSYFKVSFVADAVLMALKKQKEKDDKKKQT